MPDNTLSCSLSNPDYRRQLGEQEAADQSDRTCHQNQCEAPPDKAAVPACRDERSVSAESVAAGYKPTKASSELAHKAAAKRKAHKARAHAAKKPAARKPTDTNAERTMARRPGPYAEAGVTSSGDSVYAGAAAAKGKDGQGAAEVFSVSGQVGAQSEVQAGMGRGHLEFWGGSVQGDWEVFTAHANAGIHNADGSTGFNESIGADAVKGSVTFHVDGAELHAGLGVGVAIPSVHEGVRDPDHDGREDLCAGIAAGPLEVSACLPNLIRW